jgi:hypothetical protein
MEPNPPKQAKFPGRANKAKDTATLRRPNEELHLAKPQLRPAKGSNSEKSEV